MVPRGLAAKQSRRRLLHRRRRDGKTDYKQRLGLIKSGEIRAIVRRTLSGVIVQFTEYNPEGDRTLASATSAQLKEFGWGVSAGNVPAAYLTGLLAGTKAKAAGVESAILDIGLQTGTKGSRLYAVLKGIIDAGISIPHNPEILPTDKRINGEHIVAWAPKAKTPSFSQYKTRPEELPKLFADTKAKIIQAKKAQG
jgi:large subunit ribosomal protein L18